MIAQIWPKNYEFDDILNLGFSSPPQMLISNCFLLILVLMIECYKTNKRTKLYHDLIKIMWIMAVQIWLKMSIFSFFGSYPNFEFLPWLQTHLFSTQMPNSGISDPAHTQRVDRNGGCWTSTKSTMSAQLQFTTE